MPYIFGYGSLINKKSRRKTLGRNTKAYPARLLPDFGYIRVWNYRHKNATFLGLIKKRSNEESNATINGVLFYVPNIDAFNEREHLYKNVLVPVEYIELLREEDTIPKDSIVYIYIPKKTLCKKSTSKYPISLAYLDICLSGALRYNINEKYDFAKEFMDTTYDWTKNIADDRSKNRREYIKENDNKIVDKFLNKYLKL